MSVEKMSEVEVSLRLAIYLATSGRAASSISVAIDGAQVRMGETLHFDVAHFMGALGWKSLGDTSRWQGTYQHPDQIRHILVHSRSGVSDVKTVLQTGQTFIAESKKGTLGRSKSSAEYSLLREALGQLLTIESVPDFSFLAVAVPAGERFMELTHRWRLAPLVTRVGIHLLTVSPTGDVQGW